MRIHIFPTDLVGVEIYSYIRRFLEPERASVFVQPSHTSCKVFPGSKISDLLKRLSDDEYLTCSISYAKVKLFLMLGTTYSVLI